MRIAHVTDVYRPRVGGIELFVEDLATRQAGAGHDVRVLASGAPMSDGTVPVLPMRVGGAPLRDVDVVHAHLSVLSPRTTVAVHAALRRRLPVVATVHSMWGGHSPVVRLVLAGCSGVTWTAVSAAAAADMRGVLGDTTVRVVPNAVDVDWWRAIDRIPAGASPLVVSVMRLAARKRPMALVQLLAGLAAEGLDFRAVIVGTGPLHDRMRAWVRRHGLDDRIVLAGALDHEAIRALHAAADVFVAPAHQESFGIAALEARSAGVPVIAMTSGGVGEFVEHGRDGLLCRDDADLVDQLRRVLTTPAALVALRSHARAVAPGHDWVQALAGFETAYDDARVAARHRARARTGSKVALSAG